MHKDRTKQFPCSNLFILYYGDFHLQRSNIIYFLSHSAANVFSQVMTCTPFVASSKAKIFFVCVYLFISQQARRLCFFFLLPLPCFFYVFCDEDPRHFLPWSVVVDNAYGILAFFQKLVNTCRQHWKACWFVILVATWSCHAKTYYSFSRRMINYTCAILFLKMIATPWDIEYMHW